MFASFSTHRGPTQPWSNGPTGSRPWAKSWASRSVINSPWASSLGGDRGSQTRRPSRTWRLEVFATRSYERSKDATHGGGDTSVGRTTPAMCRFRSFLVHSGGRRGPYARGKGGCFGHELMQCMCGCGVQFCSGLPSRERKMIQSFLEHLPWVNKSTMECPTHYTNYLWIFRQDTSTGSSRPLVG